MAALAENDLSRSEGTSLHTMDFDKYVDKPLCGRGLMPVGFV
jgi:hypothetical protein